jgi:hypothetical protein
MEKFDKSIVNHLIENFEQAGKPSPFEEVNYKLKVAKSIDDVMRAKKELLLEILKSLPMDGMFCYFCYVTKCEVCSYAKTHGRCGQYYGENSTWFKIVKMIKDLRECIEKEYWTGEELKEEV